MQKLIGYIGTYESPASPGIDCFSLDLETGRLSAPQRRFAVPDSKYLSLFDGVLAAPVRRDGRAGICLLDIDSPGDSPLGECLPEQSPACFVTQDERYVYTANYHEGNVLVYDKSGKTPRLARTISIAPGAGCHQILFTGDYMLVPCLLLDRVNIYDRSQNFAEAGAIPFEPGTGPRHGVFDRAGRRLFLVSELSNELFVYEWTDPTSVRLRGRTPILPQNFTSDPAPASAAIRLSADERFLYVSTRFADVITVFALDGFQAAPIQQVGSGGVHPRDFVLTPDGNYLLAANRTQGGLACFRLDPTSGKIGALCSSVPAPEAVSIVLSQDKRSNATGAV